MNNKIKKVLVTGGSGFIGTHIVDHLHNKGLKAIVLKRQDSSRHSDGEFFFGDITDPDAVMEAIGLCNGAIHLAGVLGTNETLLSPELSVDVNIIGSLNVFEACRIHHRKCVNVSVGNHWMNNTYAITKSTAERFSFMYNKELGTDICNVRVFNVYGPGQKAKPVKKLIPNVLISALRNDEIIIYGNGEQLIDLIYVEDAAMILVESLLAEINVKNLTIEAGTGVGISINEAVKTIVRLTGSRSKVTHVPMRKGEHPDSKVIADANSLTAIGISKERLLSFEQGIQRTIPWYSSNLDKL